MSFLQAQGHGRTEAVRLVAAELHTDAHGTVQQVSEATIWRWLRAYDEGGPEALEPGARAPRRDCVLPEDLRDYIRAERALDDGASIPELLKRAVQVGVLHPDHDIHRSTVHRWMVREDIPTRPRQRPADADTRRWSYAERMQLVMLDFVHFRASANLLKRCAVYVLDDATRRALGCAVTTSENSDTVLGVLAWVLRRYGRFDAVYVDQGSGFIAHDVTGALANLGIALIHGSVRYPEGRGKLERFNRTLRARLLRGLRHPDVDPDCVALTLRCRHDAFELYNHDDHEELDGTPQQAWLGSDRDLRPVDEAELLRAFTIVEDRLVSADHVISFGGVDWEVPRGIATRQKVDVHRRVLERDDELPALYVEHRSELVRLHPVDLVGNATSRRGDEAPPPDDRPVRKTASMLAYEKTLSPMTGPDGGYPDPDDEE